MKKSEELKIQAQTEDNDLKALGIYTKILREERFERFKKYKSELIAKGFSLIENEEQGKITIETKTYGTLDYYPKANKILIRKKNKWNKAGLHWIIKNLL